MPKEEGTSHLGSSTSTYMRFLSLVLPPQPPLEGRYTRTHGTTGPCERVVGPATTARTQPLLSRTDVRAFSSGGSRLVALFFFFPARVVVRLFSKRFRLWRPRVGQTCARKPGSSSRAGCTRTGWKDALPSASTKALGAGAAAAAAPGCRSRPASFIFGRL